MPDRRPARGILDTSVVIDLEHIEPSRLPIEVAVSAITMADVSFVDSRWDRAAR